MALALAAPTAVSQPAAAQSFNCASAGATDERAICASPELSAMDTEMAALYGAIRRCAMMGVRGDLEDSQRQFLATRAACGADVPCLTVAYRGRIDDLKALKASVGKGAC